MQVWQGWATEQLEISKDFKEPPMYNLLTDAHACSNAAWLSLRGPTRRSRALALGIRIATCTAATIRRQATTRTQTVVHTFFSVHCHVVHTALVSIHRHILVAPFSAFVYSTPDSTTRSGKTRRAKLQSSSPMASLLVSSMPPLLLPLVVPLALPLALPFLAFSLASSFAALLL